MSEPNEIADSARRIAELEEALQLKSPSFEGSSAFVRLHQDTVKERDTLRARVNELEYRLLKASGHGLAFIAAADAEVDKWVAAAKEMAEALEAILAPSTSTTAFSQGNKALAKFKALK